MQKVCDTLTRSSFLKDWPNHCCLCNNNIIPCWLVCQLGFSFDLFDRLDHLPQKPTHVLASFTTDRSSTSEETIEWDRPIILVCLCNKGMILVNLHIVLNDLSLLFSCGIIIFVIKLKLHDNENSNNNDNNNSNDNTNSNNNNNNYDDNHNMTNHSRYISILLCLYLTV